MNKLRDNFTICEQNGTLPNKLSELYETNNIELSRIHDNDIILYNPFGCNVHKINNKGYALTNNDLNTHTKTGKSIDGEIIKPNKNELKYHFKNESENDEKRELIGKYRNSDSDLTIPGQPQHKSRRSNEIELTSNNNNNNSNNFIISEDEFKERFARSTKKMNENSANDELKSPAINTDVSYVDISVNVDENGTVIDKSHMGSSASPTNNSITIIKNNSSNNELIPKIVPQSKASIKTPSFSISMMKSPPYTNLNNSNDKLNLIQLHPPIMEINNENDSKIPNNPILNNVVSPKIILQNDTTSNNTNDNNDDNMYDNIDKPWTPTPPLLKEAVQQVSSLKVQSTLEDQAKQKELFDKFKRIIGDDTDDDSDDITIIHRKNIESENLALQKSDPMKTIKHRFSHSKPDNPIHRDSNTSNNNNHNDYENKEDIIYDESKEQVLHTPKSPKKYFKYNQSMTLSLPKANAKSIRGKNLLKGRAKSQSITNQANSFRNNNLSPTNISINNEYKGHKTRESDTIKTDTDFNITPKHINNNETKNEANDIIINPNENLNRKSLDNKGFIIKDNEYSESNNNSQSEINVYSSIKSNNYNNNDSNIDNNHLNIPNSYHMRTNTSGTEIMYQDNNDYDETHKNIINIITTKNKIERNVSRTERNIDIDIGMSQSKSKYNDLLSK